jgi:hypothetical protein
MSNKQEAMKILWLGRIHNNYMTGLLCRLEANKETLTKKRNEMRVNSRKS